MKVITADQIAKATGGVLMNGFRRALVTSVAIDSREVEPGALFVALKGERTDGHDYAKQAVEKGCTAMLVSAKREDAFAAALNAYVAVIRVPDTERALQDLAEWYLYQLKPICVGVTGSVGKTGTKEMVQAVFSQKYRTTATKGNHNNMIGLPLTVFQAEEDTEAVILEMGMDCFGEIHRYAELSQPKVGIITNIGLSHVERLGSRENILKAKMEITDFFDETCTLILNRDNDLLKGVSAAVPYQVIGIGETAELRGPEDIRISDVQDFGIEGISFVLTCGKEQQKFRLPVPGKHNALNAALAAAAGRLYGISLAQAAAGLAELPKTDKRLNVETLHGIQVINDTYNASPDSMRAGLDVLARMECRRRAAVLGDMFELGSEEKKYHEQVGQYAAQKEVALLLTIGENARFYGEGALKEDPQVEVHHYQDKETLLREAVSLLQEGDAVLVKGSRAMAMEEVVEVLRR